MSLDDDPRITDLVRRILTFDGYSVAVAATGDQALTRMLEHPPDTMVLDIMLPGIDGLEVVRRLREAGDQVPILLLTARDAVPDRVKGLETGADDYLVKPFAPEELLARVKALLRRGQTERAEILRLSQLVDELLLARADAGADAGAAGAPVAEASCRQVTELDRVVLLLVRQLRGRLQAEGSPVRIDLGRIEPVRVHGDEETLRRVAVILLDNAIKYCAPHPAVEARPITISLERTNDEAVLRVHDSGIGISADDLPHIFDRFFRADQARGRQGTGLGLSIAQTLVEQLGGHLDAQSTPGQGSTFSLAVPIAAGQ